MPTLRSASSDAIYLHLGKGTIVRTGSIVGIFDLDITSQSYLTRNYLSRAEKAGQIINAAEDLPKSFILCADGSVYLSGLNAATLLRRAENEIYE